ncbi:MAG: MG2 domain-containing protein [Nitrospirae bacterium]|nr:MG2 domain-containing protein [Nitrospirota bacterium]
MKFRVLFFSVLFFISAFVSPVFARTGAQAEITSFSPQGTVKQVRQVRVGFSEQIVPFGEARLAEPFTIRCPEKGKGRWADGKNWIYDFERDIPAGVTCEFTLGDAVTTLSGGAITGQRRFSFSTGGPAITDSQPHEGSEQIDEKQIFILMLNAEASEDSVLKNVSCAVEGVNEKIGITILGGEERERILRTIRYRDQGEQPLLVVRCRQTFPNGSEVRLIWGKGVRSLSGVGTMEDQVLAFKTRGPFTASFSCDRENPKAECIPVLPMRLLFSSPLSWESARKVLLRSPSRVYRPQRAETGDDDSGEEREDYVYSLLFKGPFPENTAFTIDIPKEMKDDAGRSLANAENFPLTVRTDAYPPLAKFSSRFGIIELGGEPVLPVTLRNLEPGVEAKMISVEGKGTAPVTLKGRIYKQSRGEEEKVIEWLRRIASAERKTSVFRKDDAAKTFSVPKPGGRKAFEVVGIPLHGPGFYAVEIESRILGASLLGEQAPLYVPAAALVTNLSAHFKWGRESSLVWVTSLDAGQPVSGAEVSVRDCKGKVIWKGKTGGNGVAMIRKRLPSEEDLPSCSFQPNYGEAPRALYVLGGGLFVFAKRAGDMTFVHSGWDEGIEPWRFALPPAADGGPVIAHTVFDRTLLRAGDTIHMKHIIRNLTMSGFSMVKGPGLPKAIVISHQGSNQRYEFPLRWDGKGVAETEWKIPAEARLGQYKVLLLKRSPAKASGKTPAAGRGGEDEESPGLDGYLSGSFRVEEFRVPLMKALIQPPKEPLINAPLTVVDLHLSYLSGGNAGGARVKLRSRTEPKHLRFDDYEEFTFANGAVKEGRTSSRGEEQIAPEKPKLHSEELTLDKGGSARASVPNPPSLTSPADQLIELEFKEPSGEIQTVSHKIPLWNSRLLVGIKPDSWASSKEAFRFQVLVLDISGKPVRDREVKVDLFRRNHYSHRKRLVGGFYSYEHVTETKRAGSLCEGKTDIRGLLVCDSKSPVSGNVILQARALDDAGNVSLAHRDVWIAGKGEWWFDISDHDRIDLLPEKKSYEPGDTAVFQVRMPFREATALVTVEREGVIRASIKKLSGKMPVIEIPVMKTYAPNVFVSVLVVRGRISGIQPTAMVDTGKPAYKLGIAEIQVGWKAHELKVVLSPEKTVYKVREKARVKIAVSRGDGTPPPKGSEVAVAAVDEGLLELMQNRSWKLLDAMMGRRGYEVRTSTAQMQVVGKRHYGLKALPQGGGGGRQVTRELFDTLLLWKARVRLDSRGEASVEIPLNDSLTSFRIVAVAQGGTGLFGTSQTSIKTTQDLMILSGLPRLVREGDRFRAGFTVRNSTGRAMEIEVNAKMNNGEKKDLTPFHESLAAGEAREIGWEVHVPYGVDILNYEVAAKEKEGGASDTLRVKQKVAEAVPARVFQATLTRLDKGMTVAVEKPADALSRKGGISLSVGPRLSQGLTGVIRYMKHYPYTCMEQKVSRAIALRDRALWKSVLAELPSHLDADGLVKYFPKMPLGSDVLTAYIVSISHEAGWELPPEIEAKMGDGLKGFVEGKVIRYSSLQAADLTIRKVAALEALSRSGRADPKLLGSIAAEPNLWPTSAVIDWANLLLRAKDIPDREAMLGEAKQIILSRLTFQGTTMAFSTERSDYLWWLMVSADLNAVKSILTFLEFGDRNGDMPRLVRGALGRQHKGAWATTAANAWGVLAIEKFSKKFEAEPVSGATSAALDEKTVTIDWGKSAGGKTIAFPWPKRKENLTITHKGTGKPWATIQGLAAIPLREPISSGYTMRKTLIPVERRNGRKWSAGDIVRVRLELEAQADMTWVVVNDPIPAGSTILGTGLGRDSLILTEGEKSEGWVWPVFEERSFEAFRAYYEFVPKGKWTIEYTVRLNNSGVFLLPPSRVEALYAPEMFGEMPNREMEVERQ